MDNLSLCSGGGGLDLGLELALGSLRTVCWVEWEAFAIEFLASRMEAKHMAQAPVWTDLRTFDGKPWRGVVDSLTAGYPCQPFSLAGKRRGQDDPRHLWPHVFRVIGECEPWLVFLENVPGHLSLGYEQVEADLQSLGYRVTPGLFTASEVGASHKRERLFILAHATRRGTESIQFSGRGQLSGVVADGTTLAHSDRKGLAKRPHIAPDNDATQFIKSGTPFNGFCCAFPPGPNGDWNGIPTYLWPATESGVCELVDGLAPDRAAWLKLLGNGVVPLQAAYAFISLWSVLRNEGKGSLTW